jgi:hypothetical protein
LKQELDQARAPADSPPKKPGSPPFGQ